MSDFEIDQSNDFEEVAFNIFINGSKVQNAPRLKKVAQTASNKLPSFNGGVGHFLAYQALDSHSQFVKGDVKQFDASFKEFHELIAALKTKEHSKILGRLNILNKDLLPVVFILGGQHPTIADLLHYVALHSTVGGWTSADRLHFKNITRWFDYLQHLPEFQSKSLALVKIDRNATSASSAAPTSEDKHEKKEKKEEKDDEKDKKDKKEKKDKKDKKEKDDDDDKKDKKEKKDKKDKKDKKEKDDDDDKKEKKEKKDKKDKKDKKEKDEKKDSKKEDDDSRPLDDVTRADIRVGKIVQVQAHEASTSLYVEQIDVGEAKPRQILSGLRNFVPLAEMQNRMVLVVCNLKPAKLVGLMSEGMVLAASNEDHTKVELVDPPAGAKPGDRLTFDGLSGNPDDQLNPKKKVFELIAAHLHTDSQGVAQYKDKSFKVGNGICRAKSINNGHVK